ncbi:hypothetical protein NQZ68_023667, partial [Dissostichus eleginoides]
LSVERAPTIVLSEFWIGTRLPGPSQRVLTGRMEFVGLRSTGCALPGGWIMIALGVEIHRVSS